MRRILLTMLLTGVAILSGCGVVGYEAKEKATFKGERILVTVESYGAAVEKDINNLAIIVLEDPNGLNRLDYTATGRGLRETSHEPEKLAEQGVRIVEALPADFWTAVLHIIEKKIVNEEIPADPNE